MRRIEVLVFARIREAAGASKVALEVESPGVVAAVRAALRARFSEHASLIASSLFAVNGEYAGPETVVPEGAEVACIPPVSGG